MQPVVTQETATQYAIRRMKLDDLEQVVAIDQSSFSLPWPAHSYRYELLENPVSRQWVAEIQIDGEVPKVIGMIVVWLILDEVHIATIAVHPQYRERGIGRQILIIALQECAALGAASVTLEVREHNHLAIDLYRQLGFEVVGRRKRYYKDTNEDAVLMTLDNQGLKSITSLTG